MFSRVINWSFLSIRLYLVPDRTLIPCVYTFEIKKFNLNFEAIQRSSIMKISLLLSLLLSTAVNAGVADIQSMFNQNGVFKVSCIGGTHERASASQITDGLVCDLSHSSELAYNKCKSVFRSSADQAICARQVRRFRLTEKKIEACRAGLSGDINEIECVRSLKFLSIEAVELCTSRMDTDSRRNECIKISSTKNLQAEDIKFCMDSFSGDVAELKCLAEL